jgi:hypothetical protein
LLVSPFDLFRRQLQAPQQSVPMAVKPGADRLETLAAQRIKPSRSKPAFFQETGAAQNAQVLRHRGPGGLEATRDLARAHLAYADEIEDRKPDRVAHGSKCRESGQHWRIIIMRKLYFTLENSYAIAFAVPRLGPIEIVRRH